jgi:hypothetical protein
VPNPTTPIEAIAGRLLGSYGDASALAALVAKRQYPSKPTQDPPGDHVVFWRVGGGDGANLAGANKLKASEIRVECISATEGGAEKIADAVDGLLNGWRDRGIGVQGCFPVGDRDEATLDDGRQVSGQTYRLHFNPKAG